MEEFMRGMKWRVVVGRESGRDMILSIGTSIGVGPDIEGRFMWGPKSQHRGKVPTFEPQEVIEIQFIYEKPDVEYFMLGTCVVSRV